MLEGMLGKSIVRRFFADNLILIPSKLTFSTLALLVLSGPAFADITFSQNQLDVVIAPECNHVPISIPYTPDPSPYDESTITVSSDSSWVNPSVNIAQDRIELSFSTESLIASYTATISVDDGENVTELFIHANVSPLDIYRLLDDPLRSKTYGIQRNGIHEGSIIAFDPVQEAPISCLTVGESPTDFVINDDSTELFVINSVGESIDVIDLETFSLKETINLPSYSAWGDADDTTANIELGPDDIIYYIDGSWGPILHVFKRSTGTVLQSLIFDGSLPSNNIGFMDIAVTSDKTKLLAMPQFGWSAGGHSATIGQFTINTNGTVNFIKQTSVSGFSREPFEAPVLMRDDDQIAVMKTISTDPANTDDLDRSFPSAIWSMNPNGSIVATGDKLYEYETGIELYTIPGGSTNGNGYTYTKAQAFTSDFTHFVYFNSSNRTLNVVNLVDEIGLEIMGRSLSPGNGSVVNSPVSLMWGPLSGIDQYDVYLGTDSDSVAAADHASPLYLGRVIGSSFVLAQTLNEGTEYFWRVDPVTDYGSEIGEVYSFRVSEIAIDISEIDVQTITGHSDFQVDIQLTSEVSGEAWTAAVDDPWVTFTQDSGSTPSILSVHLDSTTLSAGFHTSTIILTTGTGQLHIPVQLEVEPLNITHIRSDRTSAKAYAISEDTTSAIPRAYLLEIDTATEQIERVLRVGSSVTDFAIHYPDNLLYVTNWKSGNLLALDKSTFTHTKSFAFSPAGATGYSQGDVYRVAAGISERLVVEEEDQWIDISLFNTNTEAVANQASVREGGGAFDPTGRYYYHGENNFSGAAIIKYDIAGDVFTQLAEVRPPEISSYYGSRTVLVSEDGTRIFWAGVVFDENLNTEWSVGETIYSTTADGRYAFGNSAIYDINLRRQVFTMPASTTVSGYNSTSAKLITQVGDELKFYSLSTPISIPAPVISASNQTLHSIGLNWTDESLEMQFFLQQRLLGSSTWTDIHTTSANVTSYTAFSLLEGTAYEFRVRASSPDYSSPWSNIITSTTALDTDGDGIFNVTDTDDDNDGMSDAYELANGLDPLDDTGVNGAFGDLDGDGFSNIDEHDAGTGPNDINNFPPTGPVRDDFDNDGDADVLIRNSSNNKWWLLRMENGTVQSGVNPGLSNASTLSYIESADYDGDGDMDILLRDTVSNQWTMHLMQSGVSSSSFDPGLWTGAALSHISSGDYDNDGDADVLLRNGNNGQWWVFRMQAGSQVQVINPGLFNDPMQWSYVSTHDYDGDGDEDVLLRNSVTGRWWMFLMDNGAAGSVLNPQLFNSITNWAYGASGDYDGDGDHDILLRNSVSGKWRMFLLTGGVTGSSLSPGLYNNPLWEHVSTNNYDGDGDDDILMRNSGNARWWMFLMNGGTTGSTLNPMMYNNPVWQPELE